MFQNIQREYKEYKKNKFQEENEYDENQYSEEGYRESQKESIKLDRKEKLLKLFSKQNIILYTIAFLLSMVGFKSENIMLSVSPFGLAFVASMLGSGQAIGIVYLLTMVGTFIKFGTNTTLTYFLTTLVFFASVLIKRPKMQEDVNEKNKVGKHMLFSVLLVQIVPMFFRNFYVYDLLTSIMLAISSFLFYKIFVNSITIIKDLGKKTVFSIEEVIGTSLLISITFCALEGVQIFGYSIKNILSILIVLILGWKNGIAVGATSGVTIGIVLGIIGDSEPVMIATYAISGMIAGIFNKLGKIGVIIGFILGNVILTYVSNGGTVPIIMFQEILIAALGLLAVPKNIKIDIQDLYGKTKLLPNTGGGGLEENKTTIFKLNSMSEAISDMAKSYEEAASTILDEDDLREQELSNEQIFIDELKVNIEPLENNILYDDIEQNNGQIIDDIFKHLLKNEIITEKELVYIFENHSNYIVGFHEKNKQVEEDVSKMIKAINLSYRISKLNFIWKKKMEESKKNVSSQLEGVSKAISDLADEIKMPEEELFKTEKKEIMHLLEQKEIIVNRVNIKKSDVGRYSVDVYTKLCDDIEGNKCDIKKVAKILNKVLGDKFTIQDQECGLRLNKNECKFSYLAQDKYKLQIGIATSTKAGSSVSGDSNLQVKLKDGKYLLAISDGMGSGPEAMKSSKIAVKMLERLLTAGFEKDVSLKLINSTLVANTKEDMYATLDIQILDLYAGNMEFIKNGACATYIKRNGDVQLLKSATLPTGIVENVDLVVYDYDLQDGDILVMCSDGIVDSNKEYINKEVWVKYFLEDIEVTDSQKIADLILNEAIDNDFGIQKDDMTVMVAKVTLSA